MDRASVAGMVDHTLLRPEATPAEVQALIAEAQELGTYSVCVSPSMLPIKMPAGLHLAVVCGFPSGAHAAQIKAAEAKLASENGAEEIDMVINLCFAKTGNWAALTDEIAQVRAAAPAPVVLKVIIESAALTDAQIVECCKAAEAAGADFVKTSTGFHKSGGASVAAVKLMRETVGDRLGVKASGGIHTGEEALAMIAAGANRLGLSGTRKVLDTLPN